MTFLLVALAAFLVMGKRNIKSTLTPTPEALPEVNHDPGGGVATETDPVQLKIMAANVKTAKAGDPPPGAMDSPYMGHPAGWGRSVMDDYGNVEVRNEHGVVVNGGIVHHPPKAPEVGAAAARKAMKTTPDFNGLYGSGARINGHIRPEVKNEEHNPPQIYPVFRGGPVTDLEQATADEKRDHNTNNEILPGQIPTAAHRRRRR